MIQCTDLHRDRFEMMLFEVKQQYFKKNYLKCAEMVNPLLIEASEYKSIASIKREILSYKRLIDFGIEEHYLKTRIELF